MREPVRLRVTVVFQIWEGLHSLFLNCKLLLWWPKTFTMAGFPAFPCICCWWQGGSVSSLVFIVSQQPKANYILSPLQEKKFALETWQAGQRGSDTESLVSITGLMSLVSQIQMAPCKWHCDTICLMLISELQPLLWNAGACIFQVSAGSVCSMPCTSPFAAWLMSSQNKDLLSSSFTEIWLFGSLSDFKLVTLFYAVYFPY